MLILNQRLRRIRKIILIGCWAVAPAINGLCLADQPQKRTSDAKSDSTTQSECVLKCSCESCGKMMESGAVCETCATKLTATANDGIGNVGKNNQMMATNDMSKPNTNFVYALDNDTERNGLLVFRRGPDGSLVQLIGSPFNTGGRGLTGGDIDEQGAIRVAGKFVLAVNPGSDSIAVLEKTPRGLLHVEGSPFPSGGSTPLSLAVHGELVYVANQAAEFANPKMEPNITGFRMMKDGSLKPIPGSTVNFPKGMGPAQVEISGSGRLLVVTAGFQVDGGEGSQIYTFHVENGGLLKAGENSPIKPEGATGTVGFSISPNNDRLYVTTFKNSGVVTFSLDPRTAAIRQIGMPSANDQRAAAGRHSPRTEELCMSAIS